MSDEKLNQRLLERHPSAYRNEDGDVVAERHGISAGGHGPTTYLINLTKLFRNARRTTRHPEHLLIEARILDEKGSLGNAAEPHSEEVGEAARNLIEDEGLQPGWEAE